MMNKKNTKLTINFMIAYCTNKILIIVLQMTRKEGNIVNFEHAKHTESAMKAVQNVHKRRSRKKCHDKWYSVKFFDMKSYLMQLLFEGSKLYVPCCLGSCT